MVTLTSKEKHIVDLFHQLPTERRPHVLLAMAGADPDAWKHYQQQGEARLRHLAEQRQLNWDSLTDDQRQDFVVDLLRESNP